MLYNSQQMEEQAILQVAAQMCAAARTAPKATGKDVICTLVLTGAEKDALADHMDAMGAGLFNYDDTVGKYGGTESFLKAVDKHMPCNMAELVGHCTARAAAGCNENRRPTPEEEATALSGLGYGALKEATAQAVVEALAPIQARYQEIIKDKDYLNAILKTNAEKAHAIAFRTLRKVYKKIGLYQI